MLTFPLALVAAGVVRDVLYSDNAFTGPNGTKHPSGWRVWTPEDFAALCPGWRVLPLTDDPPVPATGQTVARRPFHEWGLDAAGVTVGYEVTPRLLDAVRAERRAALADLRWTRETGGIVLNGAAISTDRESQGLVNGALALMSADPGRLIDWKTGAGWVRLDAATIAQIAFAVGAHVQACFSHERELSEEIDAALSFEALDAIDLTAGWPSPLVSL